MKKTVAVVAVCIAATTLGTQSPRPTHAVDSALLAAASQVLGASDAAEHDD